MMKYIFFLHGDGEAKLHHYNPTQERKRGSADSKNKPSTVPLTGHITCYLPVHNRVIPKRQILFVIPLFHINILN